MQNVEREDKTIKLIRSYDCIGNKGTHNPWRLLSAAIIFQAAIDCEAVKRYGDDYFALCCYAKGSTKDMTREALLDFINSEWLEYLLSWQGDISIEAVRENLKRRLSNEIVFT